MKLSHKLLAAFLAVGVIPFTVISVIALNTASNSLEEKAFDQLKAVRDIKAQRIGSFFAERQGDMNVVQQTVVALQDAAIDKLDSVQQNKAAALELLASQWQIDITAQQTRSICTKGVDVFTEYLKTGKKPADYDRLAAITDEFIEQTGYYDYFIINKDGLCVYTPAKEADYKSNLLNGPYAKSGLGDVVRGALSGEVTYADFAPYAPSGGQQAAFVGAPILRGSEIVGVVALQINMDRLLKVVEDRAGLGQTGETYLVGKSKGKTSFRSNMTTMGGGKYVVGYEISTPYIEAALSGQSDVGIHTDSLGNLVIVAYQPLEMNGLNWACVTKMNVEEAIVPDSGGGKDYFAKYIEEYGYYDLFLIAPNGCCFYTVTHEADYQTNLVDGTYADSGLGELTREILETRRFAMADYASYAPSNGDPAAFIGMPIMQHDKVELVVALQLSIEAINEVMQESSGMGTTGETYLIGSDNLMRSDSRLDPTNHSVKASFADPAKGSVKTDGAKAALAGKDGAEIIIDYNGNPVLSAYRPLDIFGHRWALLAEIDEWEAFQTVSSLRSLVLLIGVIGVGVIIVVALYMARMIANPLQQAIITLSQGAEQTSSASGQVSSASQSLAEGSSEQASSLEETSSSLEEMSSMTERNAEGAKRANELATQTRQAADSGANQMEAMSTAMSDIQRSSSEIANIIKTIDEIAFQTNILALNAAVEAARAGEAGMGFAVVADEVRSLAQRSAVAARETSEKIEAAVSSSRNGVEISGKVAESLNEIVNKARQVDGLVSEIATASMEQSQGIQQINEAVSQMDQVTQSNAANAEETASAAEELNAQSEELMSVVRDLKELIGMNNDELHGVYRRPVMKQAAPASKTNQSGRLTNTGKSHKKLTNDPLPDDFKDF